MEFEGRIVAVCLSITREYPKYPQPSVAVGPHGFEGDAHSGPLRESYTQPGVLKPNDRAVSIVADETRREVNEQLGLDMQPGDFNENLLVEGVGDLHDFEGGEILEFESGVVLQITGQNTPCKKLESHNGPGLIKATLKKKGTIYNKRGLVATVVTPGELRPGESFIVR